MEILQPKGWKRPNGYSNGIKVDGDMIYVAGQVGWNDRNEITSAGLVDQILQALRNVASVLETGSAKPKHIVRMTWYVTETEEYLSLQKEIGQAYRSVMGDHYPAMTVIEVAGLIEEGAKIEIEATAVIPSDRRGQVDAGIDD